MQTSTEVNVQQKRLSTFRRLAQIKLVTRLPILIFAGSLGIACAGQNQNDIDDARNDRDRDVQSEETGSTDESSEALAPGDPGAVRQIASTNEVPWGLAFLPDGSALIAGRNTYNVIRVAPNGQTAVVGRIPNGGPRGSEGGALGVALSPNFATDHWVYFFHTAPNDNRIVRIKYENGQLVASSHSVVLTGIARASIHNAGRLRFGPRDNMLYAGTGDANNRPNSQNVNSKNGKILRLTPEGGIPADNPFPNSYTWAYGLRDPQGLAFDSQGRLWVSEFGQDTWDELNLIQKGGNYGWPTCEGRCSTSGFINPVQQWRTSEASPSGLAIVKDVLYLASLRGQRLWVMTINGNTTTAPRAFFQGTYGRLRTVEPAPGGGLWLTTSNNDGRGSGAAAQILDVALQ
ncbi:PQQ-dependent sugar dehydrogenase [Pendulispora albinea]|uniref:PQQ-dependent sugar dehydrogenase n=1 Tax=Pendulispora albinea TaxID=2741071 RepID=A0ABZ2M1B8_9BACT